MIPRPAKDGDGTLTPCVKPEGFSNFSPHEKKTQPFRLKRNPCFSGVFLYLCTLLVVASVVGVRIY